MDSLKSQKVKVLAGFLEKIYKNHSLPFYPQTLEWTAELMLEKLEEIEVIDMERHYEADQLSHD